MFFSKTLWIGLFSLLFCLTARAAHSTTFTAIVSECFSNRNYFENDKCKRIGINTCSVALNGKKISVAFKGLSTIKANIPEAFHQYPIKNGYVYRSELNFGGLKRGMVQFSTDYKKRKRVLALDVYFNKTYSGESYTRYRCGRFQ